MPVERHSISFGNSSMVGFQCHRDCYEQVDLSGPFSMPFPDC